MDWKGGGSWISIYDWKLVDVECDNLKRGRLSYPVGGEVVRLEIAGRGVCDTPLRGKVEPLWGSLNWVGGGTTGWHRWLVIFDYVAVGDSSSAKWVMNYFLERIAGCGAVFSMFSHRFTA